MRRPSRNCPPDDLRAGTVKARRPRARAGGAKRSALHGAEHRCSIVFVMAIASNAIQSVITARRPEVDIECTAREATFSRTAIGQQARFNATCLRATFSGRTGPD
jgi:hypothetical protein